MLFLCYYFYLGDVVWMEEGYCYLWWMMLCFKIGFGIFKIVYQDMGEIMIVWLKDYFLEWQECKLYIYLDMILQFVYFLEKEFEVEGQEVVVYVNICCKFNYCDYYDYIDLEWDFMQEEWLFWKFFDWILLE